MTRRLAGLVPVLLFVFAATACAGANDDGVACGQVTNASKPLTRVLHTYQTDPAAAISALEQLDAVLVKSGGNAAQGSAVSHAIATADRQTRAMEAALKRGETPSPAALVATAKKITNLCNQQLNLPPG